MNKRITNAIEFIIEFIDDREAPRSAIDITFVRTLRNLSDSLVCQRIHSLHSKMGYPIPVFIYQTLEKCELEYNMKFIEYIFYLKVYKEQSIFKFISKKKKDIIIKEINDQYHVRIDYKMLRKYLNTSFEELAENLGHDLVIKRY